MTVCSLLLSPPPSSPSLCLSSSLCRILIWSVLPRLVNIYISAFKCCLYMALICYLTHTHTRASTPRRGQTVNQTFRHPDSGSAAMSIIGQERERREASGRRVPHGQKGGGGPSFATRAFCGEGTSASLVQRHLGRLL